MTRRERDRQRREPAAGERGQLAPERGRTRLVRAERELPEQEQRGRDERGLARERGGEGERAHREPWRAAPALARAWRGGRRRAGARSRAAPSGRPPAPPPRPPPDGAPRGRPRPRRRGRRARWPAAARTRRTRREDGGGGGEVEEQVDGVEGKRVRARGGALERVGRLEQRPVGRAQRGGEARGGGGRIGEHVGAVVPDEAGGEHRRERHGDERQQGGHGRGAARAVGSGERRARGGLQRLPSFRWRGSAPAS